MNLGSWDKMAKEILEACEYCGLPFSDEEYRLKLTLHHVDGDHFNNDPKNRMTIHFGCHSKIHHTGNQHQKGKVGFWKDKCRSKKTKKRMSEAKSGRKNPIFGRIGKDAPMFGKHHSEETKRKMSISLRLSHMIEKYLNESEFRLLG